MKKWFWWVIVAVVAGMIGVFLLVGDDTTDNHLANYDPDTVQLTDYIWGFDNTDKTEADLDAYIAGKPVVVEYGDFQCSGCAYFAIYSMDPIQQQYGDRVIFVYRHFPLTSIHPYTMMAHRAATAAANQGQFWEMHDLLYSRQQFWVESADPAAVFVTYAGELGLDVVQFELDVEDSATYNRIDNDIESAGQYRINGTPTLFINGEVVDGVPSFEQFSSLLDAALIEMVTEDSSSTVTE